MPFLIERFVRHPLLVPKAKDTVPDGTLAELKRFFHDTAQTSNRGSMSALAAIIPPSQIVFGTDFPYRTGIDHVKGCARRACSRTSRWRRSNAAMRSS
jgi:hypothetical protein